MNLGIFLERYGRPSLTKNRDRDVDQIWGSLRSFYWEV
jgi:hypothetical protein